MNKKKITIIVVFISVIVFVAGGFGVFKIVKNIQTEKEHEQWLKEQQREYEERNNTLYDKYNGCWCSKEDERLYFNNVSLNVGKSSWRGDDNLYFQVYYDSGYCDACGWYDFLIYEEDDNKLGYEDTVYYRL